MLPSDHPKLPPAQRVTMVIAALLKRGVRPWKARWNAGVSGALPLRANGLPYRGMNVVALWAAALEAGYTSPYWFTFKQALALGGNVRKGERGTFVIFYKPAAAAEARTTQDEDETLSVRAILRGYVVFNHAQVDGLDGRFPFIADSAVSATDDYAERFAKIGASIQHGGARAFYAPSTDHVQMPPQAAFTNLPLYYATLAHELGHWTRHPSRLNRDFGHKRFADHGYAMEELVAELCAAFVGAVIGLPPDHVEDHATYIDSWLAALEGAPSAFLTAAGKAQIAADYLLRLMGEPGCTDVPQSCEASRAPA